MRISRVVSTCPSNKSPSILNSYERNPVEQDPHIACLGRCANFWPHLVCASIEGMQRRGVFDYPNPDPWIIFLSVSRDKSLQVYSVCYSQALQAEFQNGFPDVTKPEGSLPSCSSHSQTRYCQSWRTLWIYWRKTKLQHPTHTTVLHSNDLAAYHTYIGSRQMDKSEVL